MTAPTLADPTCGARNRSGGACSLVAGWGTTHVGEGRCKLHGGAAPQVQAAAARRQEAAALEQAVAALGLPITKDPVQGLLDELAQTLGELEWLRQLVRAEAGQDPEALFRGTRYVRRKESPDGTETVSEAGPGLSTKLQLYERWKRIYREQVAVALAHDISQAVITIAEREAETFGALVAAALDAADVAGDARVRALNAARDRFLLIRGEAS